MLSAETVLGFAGRGPPHRQVLGCSTPLVGVCQRCSDRGGLTRGGTIYALRQEPKDALFPVGTISVTAGAIRAAERPANRRGLPRPSTPSRATRGDRTPRGNGVTEEEVRGAWPSPKDDDAMLNKVTLHNRLGRLLSGYRTAAGKTSWADHHAELGDAPETAVMPPRSTEPTLITRRRPPHLIEELPVNCNLEPFPFNTKQERTAGLGRGWHSSAMFPGPDAALPPDRPCL